jgi:hypothetical protein
MTTTDPRQHDKALTLPLGVTAETVAARRGTQAGMPPFSLLAGGQPGMGKGGQLRLVIRPASYCPDHPARVLTVPGGAARGICPVDGRSYQLDTPEVA